ncbi:putative ankyrin repeat containing protein [Phaeomoniella chlamydospora]|uniref:Putative ankyrin repeat containing protein n=1 Tax=Phaeomoniella chlamydospora TaxID=158046 RepID=A0A0G2EQA2_PHACM|nr:putative ankyrin repeat containing protein [Phaeomoniella chlamydospora]
MSQSNPFLLAADNSPALRTLLEQDRSLAASQDAHGYSLLHAAASYNHLDLLRSLVTQFGVDINMKDEDGETCLFVVESVDAAKCLVEELYIDTSITNDEGQTAEQKIAEEDDFPEVAEYIRLKSALSGASAAANGTTITEAPLSLPRNIKVDIGTMSEAPINGDGEVQEPNPEFRRRIEELAAREDFNTEAGQRELRDLVTDAIKEVNNDEREVRRRLG